MFIKTYLLMGKTKFEESLANGPHAKLQSYVGQWIGTTKTWFEKDILADESAIAGEIESILGNKFIRFTYQGSLQNKALEGIMTWGYDLSNSRAECSWVDTFHMGTGILHSIGAAVADGFYATGSYGSSEYTEIWGWRTEITLRDDELIITMYNISPEGEEAKAVENKMKRA